jgi:predicted dithiol-disulfide oxidoreductase (DUF899 family)
MKRPKMVSRDEWTTARKRLLVKEKAFNRQRDALSVPSGRGRHHEMASTTISTEAAGSREVD